MKLNKDKTRILAFKESIKSVYVLSVAEQGVKILQDVRKLTEESPFPNTFAFSQRFYDFESFVVFNKEMNSNVFLALAAVWLVVYINTGNTIVTNFIMLCVALVDLFLFALLYFWGVTLNSVTVVNIVIAIGLAVDYSAHIGHAYLTVKPPTHDENGKELSDMEKRQFKARGALKEIGGSVFHGAFSTFLAILVLGPSKSYIFMTFFKMWFGIIVFGCANGFILLPVLLSLWGPLTEIEKVKPK